MRLRAGPPPQALAAARRRGMPARSPTAGTRRPSSCAASRRPRAGRSRRGRHSWTSIRGGRPGAPARRGGGGGGARRHLQAACDLNREGRSKKLRYELNKQPDWVHQPGRRDRQAARRRGDGLFASEMTASSRATTTTRHACSARTRSRARCRARACSRPRVTSSSSPPASPAGRGTGGVFEGTIAGEDAAAGHIRAEITSRRQNVHDRGPYRFRFRTLSDLDEHLFREGATQSCGRRWRTRARARRRRRPSFAVGRAARSVASRTT